MIIRHVRIILHCLDLEYNDNIFPNFDQLGWDFDRDGRKYFDSYTGQEMSMPTVA